MSFINQKALQCALCEKKVSIKEECFPEDLHGLLSKYCVPQLCWLCKYCSGKRSNLKDDVKFLKTKIQNLENEVAEIKKCLQLKATDYNCGDVESAGIKMGCPQMDGNSYRYFQSCNKVDCLPSSSEDNSSIDSGLSSISFNFQKINLHSTLISDDNQKAMLPVSPAQSRVFTPYSGTLDFLNKNFTSDSVPPKQKKEALALIHLVSNTKIKIDDKESTKSSNAVDVFLKCITRFLKRDPVFSNLYSRDYRTGSSYNDLRISAASEYDIDIVFKAPSEINLEVEFFNETSAYAKIKWQKVADVPDNKFSVQKFFVKNSLNGYLQPLKISAWFHGLIDTFLLDNPTIPGIKQIKNRQSGPARTIEIVTDEEYVLNIDLVPVFVFSYDSLKTTKTNEILEKYPVDESKKFWFLVPKQCQGEEQLLASDCKLSWRVDFPEIEKKVLHNKQSAKQVVRLLKLLRDEQNWKIASYYIKTLILWGVHKNPESEYWKGNVLFERYMETLKLFKECVKNQCLPFFMDPSYNLFHALNKDECQNLGNRLQRIITSIEADHTNLNKIYKFDTGC